MYMKRGISAKILGLVLSVMTLFSVFAFASCGESEEGGEGGTLIVGIDGTSAEVANFKAFSQPFTRKTKIKIITKNIEGGHVAGVTRLVGLGSAKPDIVYVMDNSAEYLTAAGIYAPLDAYFERDGIDRGDFYDAVIDFAKSGNDDKLYWMPRDYNKVVTYYNRAVFDAAGLPYPDPETFTWDKMLEICGQLLNAENDIMESLGTSSFFPIHVDLKWRPLYSAIIAAEGGAFFPDGETPLGNESAVIRALDRIKNLTDNKYCIKPSDLGYAQFTSNGCAFTFSSRPMTRSCITNDMDFDFLPFPYIQSNAEGAKAYVGVGCTGFAITQVSKQKELAWEFIKYIISAEGQDGFCETGAGIPIRKAMGSDPDASFKKLPAGKTLRHEVFVDEMERDFPVSFLKGKVDSSKHLALYDNYAAMISEYCGYTGSKTDFIGTWNDILISKLG
jgi:multiple sugar transport system substrate-binding protein